MRLRLIGAGARPGAPQTDHDRIFTIPNILTVVRFLGVPLFVWLVLAQEQYGYAMLVLALMASTDWVDGYVARRFDQQSKLGRVLDPMADRIALLTVAVTLVVADIAPWWLLALLIVPDAVLTAVSVIFFRGTRTCRSASSVKMRMAALLVGTPTAGAGQGRRLRTQRRPNRRLGVPGDRCRRAPRGGRQLLPGHAGEAPRASSPASRPGRRNSRRPHRPGHPPGPARPGGIA